MVCKSIFSKIYDFSGCHLKELCKHMQGRGLLLWSRRFYFLVCFMYILSEREVELYSLTKRCLCACIQWFEIKSWSVDFCVFLGDKIFNWSGDIFYYWHFQVAMWFLIVSIETVGSQVSEISPQRSDDFKWIRLYF